MGQEKIGFIGLGNLGKAIADKITAGGSIDISRKDIGTFVEEAKAAGCRHSVAESAYEAIKELQEASPGVDQTFMLPFTRDGGTTSN